MKSSERVTTPSAMERERGSRTMRSRWLAFASVLGVACTNGGANVGSTRSDEGTLVTDGGVASVEGFAWLVQLGGTGADQARGIAANADGVYVLGQSRRANEGPEGRSSSGNAESFDVWVRQLELTGELGWERWIGSAQDDHAGGIALDTQGNVYVVGHTDGALRGDTLGAPDAFVTKLDARGNVAWTLQVGVADGETYAGKNSFVVKAEIGKGTAAHEH